MNLVEIVVTISGAVGLADLLRYTIEWVRNRNKDKAEVDVISTSVMNETTKFYVTSLQDINKQFSDYRKATDEILASQTKELASTKAVIYELIKRIHVIIDETCLDKECMDRKLADLPELEKLLNSVK